MKKILRSRRTGKPYIPHPGQQELHNSKKRFRIACCGRRWGKTTGAFMDRLRYMIEHPNSIGFWVVPKYKELIPLSEVIREWLPWKIVKQRFRLHETYRYLKLTNGAKMWMHSAEDPDSLRGPGLDWVVLEEAAQLKAEVWEAIIRPELFDSGGSAIIITTPKGKNWVYKEFLRGKSGKWPNYQCWQKSTYERLKGMEEGPEKEALKERIEEERKSLPEDIFRQEWLAQFIEGGGSVFRGVRRCFRGGIDEELFNVLRYSDGIRVVPKQVVKDKLTYVGVDIGRHEAFTVFLALDEDGNLIGFERFRRLDFPFQKERLIAFLEYFPRREIAMDARGMGSSFFEDLKYKDIYIDPVILSNPSKNSMIHNLIIKLDDMKIRGPFIEQLVEELEAFSYHMSASGNVIYEAPENYYDDCVMSLAMAASKLHTKATDWVSSTGTGYMSRR